jgi:hypothetical protein
MNKIKRLSFAFLLSFVIAGSAMAAGIPDVGDPANFPEIWTMLVYNNYTSDLVTGSVVIWDCDASTGDYVNQLPYITATATGDHVKCAGVVVGSTITASDVGSICVFGPVPARIADSTDTVTEDELVSTTTVAGQAGGFTTASDSGYLGYLISDTGRSVDDTQMPVFVRPGNDG